MKKRKYLIFVIILFMVCSCGKKEKLDDYSRNIKPEDTIFFKNIDYSANDLNNSSDNDHDSNNNTLSNKKYYRKNNDGKYIEVTKEEDFEIYEIYTVTVSNSGEVTYEEVNKSEIDKSNISNDKENNKNNNFTPSNRSESSNNNNASSNNSNNDNNSNDSSNTTKKSNLVSYNGWLSLNGTNIVNANGEKFQLKGMSSHGLQWYGDLINEKNIRILRDEWNSNIFRIAMYTSEGGYIDNMSLYDTLIKKIDMLIQNDMYVIIDWHILSDNNPNIYLNESVVFFNKISKKYANVPNVLYEICNEPHWVSWDNDIKPYADKVIKVIRKNSSKALIIVGTNTWSQDVTDPINNRIEDNNVLYALHFYSGTHKEDLRNKANQALNAGLPIFVSEWGVSYASGNGGVNLNEANKWVTWMNRNNISFTSWSLSNKNESSAILKSGMTIINDNNLSDAGVYLKRAIKG